MARARRSAASGTPGSRCGGWRAAWGRRCHVFGAGGTVHHVRADVQPEDNPLGPTRPVVTRPTGPTVRRRPGYRTAPPARSGATGPRPARAGGNRGTAVKVSVRG